MAAIQPWFKTINHVLSILPYDAYTNGKADSGSQI